MSVNIDFKKILKAALKEGGEFADIFVERSITTSITCEDNRIEKVISGIDSGAGIRVIFNKRSAYAFSNDLSEGSPPFAGRICCQGGKRRHPRYSDGP